MSFPTSPINGQIAVVNNIAYEYATANSSWTRVLSIANIIQANVISANVLNVVQAFSIAGNIATANYFIGNGAFLTGLPASYSNANVANYLPTYTGNLVSLTGPVTTTGNITANNVLFGTGVVSGTGTVYAATVSTTGNVNSGFLSTGEASVGNLFSGGYVSASGNVTGSYIFGNGALLTGVITSVSNINNGTSNITVVSSGGNITVGVGGTGNVAVFSTDVVTVKGNVLPGANVTYDLGTSTQRWRDLWLSNSTIYLGNAQISANATAVTITNPAGGTTVLQGSTPSITGDVVSASGNVTGGNLITGGLISAAGNITGGNILGGANVNATTHTGTTVSVTANVTGGNLLTGGLINATGNITGGNVNTNQVVGTGLTLVSTGDLTLSATGNINVNNEYINNVPTPVADGDAVNKLYVDNFVTGLNVHDAVKAATPTTLATITSGTITYYNGPGSNGTGATLSTTGTFNLIDTVNVQTAGTRILVLNEANAVTNGVYVWSNATAITRASDYNSLPEVEAGDFMFVTNGATYGNTGWIQTSTVSNIGFAGNNITFTQFSGSGTYSAGTGLTLTGTTFSVNASQTQITSVGTLGSLAVTGNITGGNILGGANVNATTHTGTTVSVTANITGGNILTGGLISATGNITGGNLVLSGGIVDNTGNLDLQTSASNANINLTPNGSGNVYSNANVFVNGLISASGNITGGNLITGAGSGGNLTGANVISANTVTATANITGGNILTGGLISATGNITSGNLLTSGVLSATGNVNGGNLNVTGNIVDTGALWINTAANGNITLNANGTGVITVMNPITNGQANGVGNIGNSTGYFNTVFAKATSAQYADLAEMYVADADYLPGTVLEFGGNHEVTVSNTVASALIAGVVSTNPAHLMNSTAQGKHLAAIALVGRVPTLVVGPVTKGAMMVSAGNGHAQACATPAMGTVIGKAVESFDGESGTIEIVVGRL